MARSEKISPLEKRLRELDKEKNLIQRDMRTLSRAARRDDTELPPLRSSSYRPEPVEKAERVDHARRTLEKAVSPDAPSMEEARPPVVSITRPPRKVVTGNERFASYFSSGSFGKGRPLTQERRTQRNKALFMLLFVLIAGFILFHILF